jgi:two-component system nitrogen regulation sensor histidine kinase NtrY
MVSEYLLHTRWRYIVVSALIATYTLAGFLFAREKHLPAVVLFISGFLVVGIVIRMYNSTNKVLTGFFNALSNDDTAMQFPPAQENKTLNALYQSMNNLNRHFQSIRLQNEYNEKYYKALIRHSAAGLLVLNSANQVELINKTACLYAGISPDSVNPNLLKIRNPLFFEAILNLKSGEDVTYKHVMGNSFHMLYFRATELRKNNGVVKLVSIQDIRHELESRELESYRKLISVLTHEIMNLMSPLTSVSKALFALYHKGDEPIGLPAVDGSMLKLTLNGLQVIDEQTDAILNFIDNYRKISKIPRPVIKPFDIADWMEQLQIVYSARMSEHGIFFNIHHDTGRKSLLADKNLINQVLVNLVNNAIDAVMENEGERRISIEITHAVPNRILILVANNGPIIPPEIQEKIFIPFFSTKEHGSGIGLSICQEIIKLHKGSLTVISSQNSLTSFVVEL